MRIAKKFILIHFLHYFRSFSFDPTNLEYWKYF